jgi:fucose permease
MPVQHLQSVSMYLILRDPRGMMGGTDLLRQGDVVLEVMADGAQGTQKLRRKPLVVLTASLYVLMFAYAFSVTMIGPLIPVFMDAYHVSLSQSGLVPLFQGLGGAVSVFLGIAFADRMRRSALIKTTFGVYCAAALLIAIAPPYAVLMILFFLIGASTRLLDAILNAYISDLHPEKRGFYLTLLHACFGVGALLGPLFSTLFISAKVHWPYIFLALGGFCIIILVVYVLVQRSIPVARPQVHSSGLKNIAFLLKDKNLVRLSLMALFYVAFALSVSTWMPSYMTKKLHTGVVLASLPVASMWVGIICGRVVYSFLSLKYPVKYLLLFSSLAAGIVMAAAVLVDMPYVYIVCLCIAGFLVGAVMPLSIATGNNTMPRYAGAVSSLLTFSGIVGLLVFPWLIGIIADSAGFWYGIVLIPLFPCAVALFSAFLPKPVK